MAYENLCMYCFEDNGGEPVCPHCGRDARAAVPQIQLLPGTELYNGRFVVGRAMGQDANGIVYMAYDTKRAATLRIREYLPRDSAKRLNDGAVVPAAGAEDAFEAGLKKLRASVESVQDPKKRHFFFEENGTGYIAQRKSAAAAAAASEEAASGRSGKQVAILIGVAAVVVLLVVFFVIRLITSAFDDPTVQPNPTLASDALWLPEETPTPTPYASATYAPIKDPELSWMDYTYSGNVENDYNDVADTLRTKSPAGTATPRPTNQTINGGSSQEAVTDLQLQLYELGWLSRDNITGSYDNATRQAVRDFQNYMNNTYAINPKLAVDGIAGAKTLYWLDQYDLSRKPTPTPTLPVKITPKPEDNVVVNESSSPEAIKYVQTQLIRLGMLPGGSADGVYGAATREAVRGFQERVNQILGQNVLKVTGEVDALSLSYLEYYAEWWENLQKNTPTPGPTTPVPTLEPTPSPTPDPGESGNRVDQNSPAESIRYVQQQLVTLGLLDQADGVYGAGTATAVRNFQIRVNQLLGYEALEISGVCDEKTLGYLEYYSEQAQTQPTPTTEVTPSPTPLVTPDPTPAEGEGEGGETDIVVSPDSDPQSILFMQQQLVTLGLLDQADGVYGAATTEAIRAFQQRVNQLQGRDVLPVNGQFDMLTSNYLEYYAALAEQDATPPPSDEPTPTAPSVGEVTDPSIDFSNVSLVDEGVNRLSGNTTISWRADGDVEGYRVQITDHLGNEYVNTTTTNTSLDVAASSLNADVVYLIEVGAIPLNGTEADMKITSAYFALEVAATPEPTEEPTPTPEPTPEPTPSVGTVSQPQINISGVSRVDGGVSYVSGDTTLSWSADGDLDAYYVRLTDSNGNEYFSRQTSETSVSLPGANLVPGVVYTLDVAAMPVNGTQADALISSAQFTLEIPATPEPTEAPTPTPEPTPEPTPSVGTVSQPQINLSGVSYSDGGVHYVSGDTTLSWSADGDLDSYYVRLTDSNGNEYFNRQTTETTVSLPGANLVPGVVYTLDVAALPVNGTQADALISSVQFSLEVPATPEPTEIPPTEAPVEPDPTESTMPSTIDQSTDAQWILQMQMKLLQFGYLYQDENPQQGVFDQATRNAVLRFQQNFNSVNESALPEINPDDPNAVVDNLTLTQLMALA